jgi:hypothetical protein
MARSALITLGLLLVLAVPAAAQDPQAQLLPPALVSVTPIKHDGAKVGTLTVERVGEAIHATASFKGRPPGKSMSVCVTVAGERRCATRKARRNGTVKLDATADFVTPLSAKARSGAARGHLTL